MALSAGFIGNGRIAAPEYAPDELKGFTRTVAEIEWLLIILIMLYQIVEGEASREPIPIYLGLTLYAAFVLGFRYFNLYRLESRWKLALETWAMILLITWVLYHLGRMDTSLANLYLLPVITSALTLGTLITFLQMGLIVSCYVFLGYSSTSDAWFWFYNAGDFMTQLAPMLLVGYITTMLSSDVRAALWRIKVVSETDELTGIYNVRAFRSLADRTHKQSLRYGHIYTIVMVDSDNLKMVNDRYGHEAGNRLLKLTVACIEQELRESDVLARYGGDEFVILLPQTNAPGALELSDRIRNVIINNPIDIQGEQLSVTVSIGIAAFREHGADLEALLKRADQALYVSKKNGRNRCTVSGAE